jgi:uncharacterized iron-regulated membrane protein
MNDVQFPAPLKEPIKRRRTVATPARNGKQGLAVWHRRLGLATAAVVIFLAITGVLLNHAHRLGLDKAHVTADWLLAWYGVRSQEAVSFPAGAHWVSWTGSGLHLDGRFVLDAEASPLGAAAAGNQLIAVAFKQGLVLLTPSGEVVERVGRESLPGTVERIGVSGQGKLVIETPHGIFATDAEMVAWQPEAAEPLWSLAQQTPAALQEALKDQHAAGPSVERVLQDLHSGRIFGAWGPWLMDAAAIAFIVLAVTGIYYWWSRRAMQPPKGRGRNYD